ncbi:hypothetical protein [Gordonia hydrophobica]|uniref:Low molecular weight antigen MTB12-like C-terminal domain-containing protein n=1 Tax=Gordonia hydrophobica TaxID=40516 RepID=A0ABZ2U6S4_9ACTN|nr:hypothetical protein [Gordonia hydrophobica]MBM7365454.1 hypothetical protein [Gordonia hydrophobica]
MYDDEQVAQPEGEPAAAGGSGSSVSWPTVMMAAGISAVVSAIVLAIGLVGLMLSDVGTRATAQEPPATVVNLGAQQQTQQPQAVAPTSAADQPSESAAPAAPVDGGTPAAQAPVADAPAANTPAATSAPTTASNAPTKPTAAQLQNDLDFIASGASNSQKAQRLEGGMRAVNQAQGVLTLASKFKPMGFRYTIIDPVTVNGTTASARIKFTSPGYQPAYMTLTWVWQDGRWKMTNKSVCQLGSYANIPCSL